MTSTADRVPAHTAPNINSQIRHEMIRRISHFVDHPDEIPNRLRELDAEWDIERSIEANAATLAFAGVALGWSGDRRWLLLPALVTGFLFQHAIQGWCPPVPVLRRLGFRTADEINQERFALKAIRGDFQRTGEEPSELAAVLRAAGITKPLR